MRTKEGDKERDILQAAILVFAERGYHKARMFRIAERAGVATGSVYLYFINKEEILNRIFNDLWKQLAEEIEALVDRTNLDPVQKLDGMIDIIFNLFINKPALSIVFVNEHNHLMMNQDRAFIEYYDRFLELAKQILAEGISKGVFQSGLDLDILRYFFFGGVRNLMHQWAQDQEKMPLDRICQLVKRIIKEGILANSIRS